VTGRLRNPVPILALLAAAVAAGTGVISGISPKYGVATAAGVVFLVIALDHVAVGVYLLAVLAIVDGQGSLGIAKLAGAVLAASWLAAIIARRPKHGTFLANHRGLTYALVALFGWLMLSVVWAESSSASISELFRYLPNMLLIPIVFDAVQERRSMAWLLGTLAVSSVAAAVLGVVTPPPDPSSADAAARTGGTFGDANEYAAALVAGMPLLVAFALRPETKRQVKALAMGGAILSLAALFSTLSRGGLVALAAALVAAVVFAGRWRARMVTIALGLLATTVVYFLLFASLPARERVTSVGGGGTGRLDLWTIGERMVSAHPTRGVGVGNFPVSSVHYLLQPGLIKRTDFIISQPKVAHNTYLQFAAELGIPAAVLWLAIVVFCLSCAARAATRFARRGELGLEILARGAPVSMIGYLAAILFISEIISKVLWLLLALGPALLAVARDPPTPQDR
jgi:O-antigen ligase